MIVYVALLFLLTVPMAALSAWVTVLLYERNHPLWHQEPHIVFKLSFWCLLFDVAWIVLLATVLYQIMVPQP
jgi:hypothetical protein